MVSEESSIVYNIVNSTTNNNNDKKLRLSGIKSNNDADNDDDDDDDNFLCADGNCQFDDNSCKVGEFVYGLLVEICDKIVSDNDININNNNNNSEVVVMARDRKINVDERSLKKAHRRISIIDDGLYQNCVDVNDNNVVCETINPVIEAKKNNKNVKKKLSFRSLFPKKHHKSNKDNDTIEHAECYDDFDPNADVSMLRSKKYASAMELNQKSQQIKRSTSFIKKLVNIGEGSKNLLKRSMSVRDLGNRKKQDRDKLSEMKEQEWRQSLQSLVENDIVSYNDFSFVNYDVMNNINYQQTINEDKGPIARTQSLIVKNFWRFMGLINQI